MDPLQEVNDLVVRTEQQLTELVDQLAVARPVSRIDLRRQLVKIRGALDLARLMIGNVRQGMKRDLEWLLEQPVAGDSKER